MDEHGDTPGMEEGSAQAREDSPISKPGTQGPGFAWGALLVFFGIAIVAVFIVQNTDAIPVRFLWLEGEFPLSMIILVTVAVSILIAELGASVARRRRKRRRADKEELRKLRAERSRPSE